ncbi:MAG: homoserine dehydrogenase [Nitrospirota bacterium]
MTARRPIRVGLIGFGTVGAGVVKILTENADLIERRLGGQIVLAGIADKDLTRDRGVKVDRSLLTDDARALIGRPDIDVIVELIGGREPAKTFLLEAIAQGKHVATANKALLAESGAEIFSAASKAGVEVGFEASVAGGIPIIQVVKESLVANRIGAIYGIINGTSNYILSRMSHEGSTFEAALAEAQRLGYAEADPTLDVGGGDSAHKLAILSAIAFGTPVDLAAVPTEGITHVTPLDIEFAREFGYAIKLLAIAKQEGDTFEARVHPTMVPETTLLAQVGDVFNAVYVVGDRVGPTLYYGRGAGSEPTGSAVVADLAAIARNIWTGSAGRVPVLGFTDEGRRPLRMKGMDEIVSHFYLRFTVRDEPGVLAAIAGRLGANRISIESVIQKGRAAGGSVPVVIMTHAAVERDVRTALAEIDRLSEVSAPTVLIRVEGGSER